MRCRWSSRSRKRNKKWGESWKHRLRSQRKRSSEAPPDHEPFPKSQEERIFDELRKNPSFNQYRYALLAIVAFGGGSMFGVAYLMFTKVLSLMDLVFAMALFVWATVFVTKRLNKMRAEVVEHLKREDEIKQREEDERARRADYEQALAEYHQRHAERSADSINNRRYNNAFYKQY